jgi:hypothetical protein
MRRTEGTNVRNADRQEDIMSIFGRAALTACFAGAVVAAVAAPPASAGVLPTSVAALKTTDTGHVVQVYWRGRLGGWGWGRGWGGAVAAGALIGTALAANAYYNPYVYGGGYYGGYYPAYYAGGYYPSAYYSGYRPQYGYGGYAPYDGGYYAGGYYARPYYGRYYGYYGGPVRRAYWRSYAYRRW